MPPVTNHGVDIEEPPRGDHTVTGVATSIAAFVGWAPEGPTSEAVLVQSWTDYARQFGGLDSRSLLGYSVSQFFSNGGGQAYIVRLVSQGGGTDGAVLDPTLETEKGGAFRTALNADGSGSGGVHLLDTVKIFNLLCVPGETEAAVIQDLQKYCHDRRAFYIVDGLGSTNLPAPSNSTPASVIDSGPVGNDAGSLTGQYSINSAYYYPWVQAADPLAGNSLRYFPPCGFVAGIYASSDTARGVWKAPAGSNASLSSTSGLQYNLTDLQVDSLNAQAVNCLRQLEVSGNVVWGARTLQGNDQSDSQWKYVPIRRLALFLESSLVEGTRWAVFEPNDEALWGQIRLSVSSFMQGLFRQGAFEGTTPQQAYFVKCDSENNTPSSIAQGIVSIVVGFAPLVAAEFVVIQIQQSAGQSQF